MKFAVMGTGGVGGYFGAKLAAAGQDVTLIARGRHLDAIKANGLKIASGTGDTLVKPAHATDDPAAIGPVDMVLFATKLWDVEASGAACKPLLKASGDGEPTGVVALQNGVDAEERLIPILGEDHVVGGVALISSFIAEPGVIQHVGEMAALEFGEMDDRQSDRVQSFHAACEAAGIKAKVSSDINAALWRKFVLLAPMAAVTSVTRARIGAIREDVETRAFAEALVAEAVAVGRAKGVDLAEDTVARTLGIIDTLPAEMRASMADDLERGNRLELPWLSGTLSRLGAELGVATPAHDFTVAALKLWQDGGAAS